MREAAAELPYTGCPVPTWPRPQHTSAGKNLPPGAWYDDAAADRAVQFFAALKHTKGKWAGTGFTLEPWQEHEFIRPLFGWKREDGSRLFRRAFLAVPRKNGKSTMSAGIAGLLLYADGEKGGEVYSAAADREQAAIVFEALKGMVEQTPPLLNRSSIFRRSIAVAKTASSYKVLSAEVGTKHGLNASGVVEDELHVIPRELHEVLTTSVGARRQPLVVEITTAGYDPNTVCREEWDYAINVSSGVVPDYAYLGVVYAAGEDADWTAPETWAAANPNLGVSISWEYLEAECERAKANPAYQNTFRRLHLNQWTSQDVRYFDLRDWDASGQEAFDPEALDGQTCYAGLDLSSSIDLTAFVMVFPLEGERFAVVPHFFIPGDDLVGRGRRDRVPYDAWVRDGFMHATPGNTIDYATVREVIRTCADRYHVVEVGYDRWGSTQLSQELQMDGITVVPIGQGIASMSPPMKDLMRLVKERKLLHVGNPVLRWNANNVTAETDAAGNVKPSKAKSTGRIDGIVALLMALDRTIRREGRRSVYEERGLEEF